MPIVAELNERFDVAVPPLLSARLDWLREADIPAGVDSASETVPEKLLRLVRVIVELPDAPARTTCDAGLADIENSDTLTVIIEE